MKLEKFRFGKKKVTIISIMAIIIILMAGIIIYESYALYEEKKSFNVLNGTVPEFGSITSKIELAFTIDGSLTEKPFPNKNDGYGVKSVVCENNVQAEWNDVAWSLILNNSNNNQKVSCTIDFTKIKIYGIERELASTSSAWTRTNDAVGKIANAQVGTTAVRNDFDNIYPWSEIKSYNYNTSTNSITAWYGESGFKFDGTSGEVLTYIPEFYYKRVQDDEYEYILISKKELEGYAKSEAFSVGRYTISGSSSGVHSKSGVLPFTNDTITNYRTYARNLGVGFGQLDYHWFIIQLLYLVEYADYNSQSKLGLGNTNNTEVLTSGGCNTLGMKSGSLNNDGKHSVIYRGIEDIQGNVWQFVDGINVKDNQTYICYDQSKYESDKFDGCYQKIGYINSQSNGWIKELGYDELNPLISLPKTNTNNSNNYITDYYYQDTGDRIVRTGGHWYDNSNSGIFGWFTKGDSITSHATISARLIKVS